ncbi:YdaU family protein [Flavobacterium litorale]|uniref:YdaU family protein n=1 Tax=Flavobacterium litorale TaxID=2856519 RepID=A0ABX8V7T6_9FLAO|nr:YdaU family protein [Flavobacterium litorale]QYJ68913.1 YdaU family protein [Flavobacterium litorale]
MKDPAFPFYAQDFLVGTMHMTCEQTGAYIKLLAYQWVNLGIPKQRIGIIIGTGWENIWLSIRDKFTERNGIYYNQRLEDEREKRARFKQKQSENGKKGGRPKKNPTPTQQKPLENESEDEKENDSSYENEKEGTGEKTSVIHPYPTEAFAQQWQLWKNYRATEHNFYYRSPQSEQAALVELSTLADTQATAIAIMHQSMSKGWKGFFELKTNEQTRTPARKGKTQYSDDFKRKIAEGLQSR